MPSNHRHRSENQIFLQVFQFQIKSLHGHPRKERDAVCNQERYEEGNREAWRALEEAYEAGNKSDG